ncbi:hypothetical protein H5410_018325 [Solanum commersonii]|uniref:S phase cyclin A-associated protein in the endoplasmic reticulum N-terminal domain-containing protein n=1 Tax=Solanum commersonii TaxID=4109 RepID=A0A9J6A1P5_SOLCO|nr:hypothetical protein H5410_018325 [Solanum commersonii]
MERNEGGDNQEGSGWMQVKKKHNRNSSKFSLHGWVGGSSQGTASGHPESQPSLAVKNEDLKSSVRHSKGSRPGIIRDDVMSVLKEDAVIVHDKCVVGHCSTSVSLGFSTDSNEGISREHSQRINHEVLPKIKWGDLDDRGLPSPFGSTAQAEIKFGDIQNHDLLSRRTDQTNDSFAHTSITDLEKNRLVATTEDENHQILDSHPLSPNMKELSSEDVNATAAYTQLEKGDTCESPGEKVKCAAREGPSGVGMRTVESEEACMEIPEVPSLDQNIKTVMVSQNPESLSPTKRGSGNIGQSFLASSNEEFRNKRVNSTIEDLSKTNSSSIDAEDSGESKERFRQRLWCFLFENLNRAVDELYLLCELECDLEQTKESILVLEEATSDFKELSSRVEEFERLKKSSSHATDGTSFTMKSNHRRPHALSWEVRRMTTSPHRAEILASSLEAFRKIQHERASMSATGVEKMEPNCYDHHCGSTSVLETFNEKGDKKSCSNESLEKSRKQSNALNPSHENLSREKRHVDSGKSASHASRLPPKEGVSTSVNGKNRRDNEKNPKPIDHLKRHYERDKEKRNGSSWRSMDAWKEKRNWEDVLSTPHRVSSRFSYSPGLSRRSAERARTLHDKLMSPEKKKKSAIDLKKEAEEKHARAMRIRTELENERVQKLQRTSEKLNRVSEWQTVRSMKLREVMYARHQRSESRHEAHLAEVVRRAGDESIKVNEVRFITSLNEENKKLILRQKLHDSELRRAEKLQVLKTKQKEDMAREEAVLERKKLIEAEKLQRLAETQRKKEEAQVRREEERKASSAAREAKTMEQMRRKEVRAKAQQEEAELLAQKLAERLRESEQRRKIYLEQIRERASMDFRDQSSPLFRRSVAKEVQGRSMPISNPEDYNENNGFAPEGSMLAPGHITTQQSLKRRIKKIRQRLMALKYDCPEPSTSTENAGFVYRTAVATARVKIAKLLQELQRLRQARKEGAASFGLITAEIIKFLEGRDAELQASRQAGLVDFIASALPASHTSKPESCQVTVYLLRLLKVVLSAAANKSYFLAQNLLPPIIPMLAAALETYIKIAASSNGSASANLVTCKASTERLELMAEVLDGFLWTAAAIIGHTSTEERSLQLQDGLIELVIAYQVIHRLRDLFALYDRPPVEGSPFPSSILLGVNLLAVLTFRFRNTSSLTCKNFPGASTHRNEKSDIELAEAADLKSSSPLCNSQNDGKLLFPGVNGGVALGLSDVPEDSPLDEFPKIKEHQGAVVNALSSDKVDSVAASMETADVLQESTSNVMYNNLQTDEKKSQDNSEGHIGGNESVMKPAVKFLLSAVSETGLVCLPSMLTAVLLQANNRCSEQQASYVLPSNFEDVATGVLKVLNNLALIDISFIQKMLARPDLKMEFFHLMSFLLSYSTSKWGTATDQIGLLLLESLPLLGYFSLFHPENQAVLRWGKSPTILHKVCDLPFMFFSDPDLMPVLAGTMVAACFGCEQNKDVIQQELSTDMLLALLKACRSSLPSANSFTIPNNPSLDEAGASAQLGPESKNLQVDVPLKSNRSSRNARVLPQRGSPLLTTRTARIRSLRENKVVKPCEGKSLKSNLPVPESTTAWMLHSRLSTDVLDKAEQFFAAVTSNENGIL